MGNVTNIGSQLIISPEEFFSEDEYDMYKAVVDWKENFGEYPEGPPTFPSDDTSEETLKEWEDAYEKVMNYLKEAE